jgi:adenylate cyclase
MIWILRLFLGFFVGLLGVLISLMPMSLALEENYGLHWLFALRGPISPPSEVVVIAIDKASADELGLPITPSLWPRNLHARLIENLSHAGAQVIAFDLRFDTPGKVPEHDVELANAMRKAGNVVTVERLDSDEPHLIKDESGRAYPAGLILKRGAVLPLIEEAAIASTAFILPKQSSINNYWAFMTSAGDTPTLPVVMLQVAALDAYEDFVRLLQNVSPARAAQLPTNRDKISVEDLILTLRGIFTEDPELARLLLAQLNLDSQLDRKTKRFIKSMLSVYSGDELRYLNFYGPSRSLKTIPYHQALRLTYAPTAGEFSNADLKGKAIFVGYSASTPHEEDRIRDDYHTVFSHADGLYLSGVEIAATAFSNLLEDRPLKPLSLAINSTIVFLWGIAITFAYAALPRRSVIVLGTAIALLSLGLAFVYGFTAYDQFTSAQIWLPLVVPLIQVPVAVLGTLFLSYYIVKREREILKKAFRKFVPPRVVSQILKSTGQITASNRLVHGSCLATDAEMYTTLAEQMDPAQLAVLMNKYYATMFEPVGRHEGIVSDVVGDAMLAIWAGASDDLSSRRKACYACLEIVEALERFSQIEASSKLRTRIGLHSGEMLLGTVGALQHYEYRAIGDMVNTTNRIQGLNKYLGTYLLVSDRVIDGLDDFLTRPVGSFLLAGRSSSLRVAELVARKRDARREQLWLCEIFADAMNSYEAQEWRRGCRNFSEILKVLPKDGPARFYLKRCQDYRDGVVVPMGLWNASIRMEAK